MEEKDEIHINVNGEEKVYTKNTYYQNDSSNCDKGSAVSKKNMIMRQFPYVALCILAYLACGFIWHIWHPTWIIFLTIPLFYSLLSGKGFLKSFPFPIFIAIAYLVIGFVWNMWHPGWVMFLTIPLYYTLINCRNLSSLLKAIYPVLCIVAYLVMGFVWNLWHPGWLIFITIPIFEGFVEMAKAAKNK